MFYLGLFNFNKGSINILGSKVVMVIVYNCGNCFIF